jgi:hypothetical protein
MPTN